MSGTDEPLQGELLEASFDTVDDLAPALGAAVGRERAEIVAKAARDALAGGAAAAKPGKSTSEYRMAMLALLLGVLAGIAGVYLEDDPLRDGGLTLAGAVTATYIGGRSLVKGLAGVKSTPTPPTPES